MEALSLIALILLSLVGYSAGVAAASRLLSDPKPGILDLILVALVWAAAIYAKVSWDVNRWLLILIFAVSAFAIAALVSVLKGRRSLAQRPGREAPESDDQTAEPISLWGRWKRFSRKMGGFQSRSILSFFYFIIVCPFALVVRIFSDPLRLRVKRGTSQSHWLAKKPVETVPDNFRKQF